MSNVALAVRQYGEGRICLSTDRIGGYLTGHGDNPWILWRRVLEWTGQRFSNESISVAVLANYQTYYANTLNGFEQIVVKEIGLHDLLFKDLSSYDVIYCIGLPESVDADAKSRIEEYVREGGGLLIESPNISGEIELLSDIESISVESINRPNEISAYWTETGRTHYIFTEEVEVNFLVTIKNTEFSTSWEILMSDVLNQDPVSSNVVSINISGQIGSEFGVSYMCRMNYGLVMIEEEPNIGSESSSSSIDSSSSSSSSSEDANKPWDICDNIKAQWKMNDNNKSPIVWESNGDFSLIGELQNGTTTVNTKDKSVTGIIDRAISLNGSTEFIETQSNYSLNFVSDGTDLPFSISAWCYLSSSANGYIARKQDAWDFYIVEGRIFFVLQNEGALRFIASNDSQISVSDWTHLTATYDGLSESGLSIYKDGNLVDSSSISIGYTSMANPYTPLSIGFAGTSFLGGYIDNVTIFDKELSEIEILGLYNFGIGTEGCDGVFPGGSSSSTSSSSSSDSSSTSVDSSSSTSLSSNSSSSSSSPSSYSSSSSSSSFNNSSLSSESIGNTSSSSTEGYSISESSQSTSSSSSDSSGGYSSESSSSLVGTIRCTDISLSTPRVCAITDFSVFGVNGDNSDNKLLYGQAYRSGSVIAYVFYKDSLRTQLVALGTIEVADIPGVFLIDEVTGSGIYGTATITSTPADGWDRLFTLGVY